MISRETSKQESSSTSDQNINLKGSTSTPTTTSWSRLKDPRVVRVSRAFGGKDRHSKVCTVRGLRDRRVRLSVPTAIQLYDLQDRLGLNQPSKVVDWLLNAAKNEIDELPPLHFPQGGFGAALLPILNINTTNSDKQALISAGKSKDEDHASPETREREENNWTRSSDQEQGRHDFNLGINQDHHSYENQNQNPSSLQSLMNGTSSSIPYNSFVRWDPSNLTLSHPPRSPPHQGEQDWQNFSISHPHHHHHHHHHQVLVYQPAAGMTAAAVQPYFQSQISTSNAGFDTKHINFQNSHLSTSSPAAESSTLPARPIHFNMTANLLPSQNNDGRG